MKPQRQRTPESGSVIATFAVSLFAVLLFFGLALDAGLVYMARATLAKSVDAAALMGVRNLGKGQAAARQIAESTFAMNYSSSGLPTRQVSYPAVAVSFVTAADGRLLVAVNATLTVSTFVIGILPQFVTMDVSAVAQGTRAKLTMGLALDRSGSMQGNGGADALPDAVETFIDFFDETFDQVALSTYADHASLDVSMRQIFKTSIRNRVNSMSFNGYTYSHGGIDSARLQIQGAPVIPGENSFKALVFFTDGHANSFLNNINCTGNTLRTLVLVPGDDTDDFRNPANGSTVTCNANRTRNFFSLKYGANRSRNSSNVTEEGLFMAERSAALTRQDGTTVFAIGLGDNIDEASLLKMANDRSSASFNPAQPEGLAVFAPSDAELDDVFRQIAARILLRLTR